MKVRSKILAVAATAASLVAVVPATSAFATTKYVDGGTWTYAATGSINYSNYYHPSKKHRSSVSNCYGTYRSADQPGGITSKVSESVCISGNQAFYYVY